MFKLYSCVVCIITSSVIIIIIIISMIVTATIVISIIVKPIHIIIAYVFGAAGGVLPDRVCADEKSRSPGLYGWKPSSSSNFSLRAFRAQIPQLELFEPILLSKLDKPFPVNSTFPPS